MDHIGPIDSVMPEKTHSDGHRNGEPGGGVRDRRKLSWDDYNPDLVESGRLESFPVRGAFDSALAAVPAAGLSFKFSARIVWAACLRANKACSNSTGGR